MLGWIDGQERDGAHKEKHTIVVHWNYAHDQNTGYADGVEHPSSKQAQESNDDFSVQKKKRYKSRVRFNLTRGEQRKSIWEEQPITPPPLLPPTLSQQQRRKSVLYEKPSYITKEWSCNCVGKSENAKRENCWWKTDVPGLLRPQGKFTVSYSPLSLCYWQSLGYCTAEQERHQDTDPERTYPENPGNFSPVNFSPGTRKIDSGKLWTR